MFCIITDHLSALNQRRPLYWVVLAIISGVLMVGVASAKPRKEKSSPVIGWVHIKKLKKSRTRMRVSAIAYALKEVSGNFIFSVRRKGNSGVASSNQSGKFNLIAGQARRLSRTVINIPQNGAFQVRLKLMVKGKTVFSAILDNNIK